MALLLFVADCHLSAARPAMVERFCALLDGTARRARALYLLGDLFDEWLGDDDDRPPHPQVEAALAALSASGVALHVAHGNHDFLLGEAFLARTGARLLAEPEPIALGAERWLLLHGDSLCTRDHAYQAFRRATRDPAAQRAFLALPLAERAAQAAALHRRSGEHTRLQPDEITDVTPEAVAEMLRAERADGMIHGHTHRPAVHELEVEGRRARRVVLGDWYREDSLAWWDGQALHRGPIAALEAAGVTA